MVITCKPRGPGTFTSVTVLKRSRQYYSNLDLDEIDIAGMPSSWSVYDNAVAPGLSLGTRFHNQHTTQESADATVTQFPLGRAGDPDDIARTITFLASEYDGFISGATIDSNGGVYRR